MEHGKRYTQDEKKEILQFRESHTFQETSEKYNVSMMTLFRWNQQLRNVHKKNIKEEKKMEMVIRLNEENGDPTKKSKSMELAKVLEVLKFLPGVKAITLINDEGQLVSMVASKEAQDLDLINIVVAMLALGQRASQELVLGNLEMIFNKSKLGLLLIVGAGPRLVLTILFDEQADVKQLFSEDFVVIERVKQAISENYP
jgi:predicted regulator of Ras-like GTPase activity (Roadblock/LC7/MglB family)